MSVTKVIKPIEWLIGKWRSISAKAQYPTMKSFTYCEELEFSFVGQPMLNYTSRTWMADSQKVMHLESGYLRINPGTNQVCFVLAHNFGVTSLEEGKVTECGMKLVSSQIFRMHFAKEPFLCKIKRNYELSEKVLEYLMCMETQTTPMTEHLKVMYEKCD